MENINFLNIEYLFFKIYDLFVNFNLTISGVDFNFEKFWVVFKIISYLISIALFFAILKLNKKLGEVGAEEERIVNTFLGEESSPEVFGSSRWGNVLKFVESESDGDWRTAILEADIVLGEFLTERGYVGESIGEKLKSIGESSVFDKNKAWEAHKIRNTIAHEGFDYELTQREVKRVISLYREVMGL
ncbi:hypothetical protein ACFLY7_01380 [Patescibacteria group bacterium]